MQDEGADPKFVLVLAARDAERRLVLVLRADPELHIGYGLSSLMKKCAPRVSSTRWSTSLRAGAAPPTAA